MSSTTPVAEKEVIVRTFLAGGRYKRGMVLTTETVQLSGTVQLNLVSKSETASLKG